MITTHKSTAAFVLTSRSNAAALVTACAVWLGVMSLLGHPLAEKSRTNQKVVEKGKPLITLAK